jgi:hypothetical protein
MNYAFKFIYKSYFKALLKMQIDDSKSNEFFFHQLTKTLIGLFFLCMHINKHDSKSAANLSIYIN